nr:hypothetical protein Itr_chr06CG17530 [Ipomoea trifida]
MTLPPENKDTEDALKPQLACHRKTGDEGRRYCCWPNGEEGAATSTAARRQKQSLLLTPPTLHCRSMSPSKLLLPADPSLSPSRTDGQRRRAANNGNSSGDGLFLLFRRRTTELSDIVDGLRRWSSAAQQRWSSSSTDSEHQATTLGLRGGSWLWRE